LQGDDAETLYAWTPRIEAAMQRAPELTDVDSDQQQKGLEALLLIDRPTAARLDLTPSTIDNTLYDAFGQRQVSTIYNALNQYHVIMEVAPRYWQNPQTLRELWVSRSGANVPGTQLTNALPGTFVTAPIEGNANSTAAEIASSPARNRAINSIAATGRSSTSTGTPVSTSRETMIPLAAFSHIGRGNTPLGVSHQGQFVATTISFNLAPGKSLSDAQAAIGQIMTDLRVPTSIHGGFAGTAATFQQSLANEPLLIAAALAAVYIVLGVLYESYVHPLTILSTLPSAGVGAVLALMLFNTEFSIIALIGVILLIGIVKKNAIMMIDFALDAERRGLQPREAIRQACILRFRPIMMTTSAAILGALPLAFGSGEGSELRHPLGISIVGGLIVSQALTLYTTPVIYLYLDRLSRWARRVWSELYLGSPGRSVAEPGA
jgi:multidrug efflux pump